MFGRKNGVYTSSLMAALPWLDHGFATRHASDWPGDYTRVRQIHSSDVVRVDASGWGDTPPEADAIISSQPGIWLGIRTADCVPILLVDAVNRAVSAVHAGWRGTAGRIVLEAVLELQREFRSKPSDLIAAIGPCIGKCCFEVGPEVEPAFEGWFPEAVQLKYIDLAETNRRQLLMAGLGAENIDVSGLCTRCGEAEFHSWRRDRETSGRMVAGIRIRN